MRTTVALDGQTPLERYTTAALVTSALGGAWVLGRDLLPFDAACPILATTGVPCPFCGFTRLADHLASGDVTLALTTDPAGAIFLALLTVLAAVGVLLRLRPEFRRWPGTPAAAALAIALAAHWATTLAGGGFVDA